MKERIFVALSTFGEHGDEPVRVLRASGHEIAGNPHGRRLTADEVVSLAADCSGIIAGVEPYTAHVLAALPKLRCVSRVGAGIDNIDLAAARERNVAIRNTPDVVTDAVAELTLGMVLDLLKNLSRHTAEMRERKWIKHTGRLLRGKRVGVIGLGRIGKRVAENFAALGAIVHGADPAADREWATRTGVAVAPVDEVIRAADVLCLHLSGSVSEFLLGAPEIAAMKTGAILVNVARGRFVDEPALHGALASGKLAGAALDVYPEEPYAGRLCELDNVVLTPHIATLTAETRLAMELEAVENVLDSLRLTGSHIPAEPGHVHRWSCSAQFREPQDEI